MASLLEVNRLLAFMRDLEQRVEELEHELAKAAAKETALFQTSGNIADIPPILERRKRGRPPKARADG